MEQKSKETIIDGNYLTRQKNVFTRMDEFMNFTYLFTWSDLIKFGLSLSYVMKSGIESPKVLDIGCGENDMFTLLKRNYCKPQYIGIDYDIKIIDKLKKSYPDNSLKPIFIQADAFNVDVIPEIKDTKFDFVLMLDLIEHVHNKEDGLIALKKAMDLLEENGLMLMTTPNNFNNSLQYPKYHDYEYSMDEIKAFIEKNNWKLLEVFGLDMKMKYNKKEKTGHVFENVVGLRNVYAASFDPEHARQIMYIISK